MKLTFLTPVRQMPGENVQRDTEPYLRRVLRPETELEFISIQKGSCTIESETQAMLNGAEVWKLAREAEKRGSDGIFVDCFDDPAVYACRECLTIPVFGGYVPSVLTAMGLAERVGIITTDEEGLLSEERKARLHGFDTRISAIRCVDMGVALLRNDTAALVDALLEACLRMKREDRVGAVCLGCTGMIQAMDQLEVKLRERDCRLTVVEPVTAGVSWLERCCVMKKTNSLGVRIPADMQDL